MTIDASRLNTVIALDEPWLSQSKDNPHFSDRNFNDSGWPLVQPGVNRLLAGNLFHPDDTHYWARLHLHILNANGPLAINMQVRNTAQYAVFANGTKIGETKGYADQNFFYAQPVPLTLPENQDVVLAIHLLHLPNATHLSLEGIEIGQSEAVQNKTDYESLRDFIRTMSRRL